MLRSHRILFLILMFFPAKILSAQNCQVAPTALHISDITSCSATFHWSYAGSGSKFLVSYKLSTSSQWAAQIHVNNDTFHHFSDLLPGVKYDFSVKAKCSDGTSSKKKKKSFTTVQCMLPGQVDIEALGSNSVKITIGDVACPFDSLYARYSILNGPSQIVSYPTADSYMITGLYYNSTYLISVSTCSPALNTWTVADTIHLIPPPNIVFVIIDDSRYDYFSCNGAPPFFQTPNIDRIANEGVNFKRSFVVTSLCQPSRASIATGLSTLETGVMTNGVNLDPSFVTIPEVLKENGYYTALVGKNDGAFLTGENPEYDFYMQFENYAKNDGKQFDYNGNTIYVDKHYQLTLTDTAIALIKRVNDPLFLWLAYVVPHLPHMPLPEFEGRYNDYIIPWSPDTAHFTVNYPSFLYNSDFAGTLHGPALDSTYRLILEEIGGLDSCMGEIFNALESTNKLDNTLLIFMSDNGYMLGSHWLKGKTMAYDPSMRIPLFMRYPKWFQPSSKISDQFALNIDIAPTIYDAAQVENNAPIDGLSLNELYKGNVSRTSFLYLMKHDMYSDDPSKRAFRDRHFKYIHYNCNTENVEELFDMVNDSLELTNLINNSNYDSIADIYRLKYDSIRIAWNDTDDGPIKNCYLANPFYLKQLFENEEISPSEPAIYPTLTNGSIEVYIPWLSASAQLFDETGNLVSQWPINETYTTVHLPPTPDGMYFLKLSGDGESVTQKLILSR